MSEITEIFNTQKEVSQQKRANNREKSAAILTKAGIRYQSKNNGAHLVIEHAGKIVDFWPGTGRWQARKGKKSQRRGVFRLLQFLGVGIQGEGVEPT